VYRRKRDVMIKSMARHFPEEARFQKPEGGLFQWVDIPAHMDTLSLLLETRKKGVVFAPDRMFAVEEWKRSGFRMSFASAEEEKIEEGVRTIGETMKVMLGPAASG